MLNKANKKILNKLDGEYKVFADKFVKEVLGKCKKDTICKEAINQTLIMVYNGYEQEKQLKEIINDQDKYIHEITKTLTPKRKSELKLIVLLSVIVNILVISLVIYFTTYSPINLKKPTIHLEENNSWIVWDEVENNTRYEIYINDKLIKTTRTPFFNYSNVNLYDFEIRIDAVGNGRYKTSSSKLKVSITKEYIVLNELSDYYYNHNPGMSDSLFDYFKSFIINYDIYNKAYIIYKPIYNGYYELSMSNGEIISISENKTILNNIDKLWFYSGKEYIIELENKNSSLISNLNLKLFRFNLNELDSIPSGKTLFTSKRNYMELSKSCNISNDNIQFANISYLDEEQIFYNQYFDSNSGFIIVNNKDSSFQALEMVLEETEITESSGSLTLHPGYNNIILPVKNVSLISIKLALYYKDTLTFYTEGMILYDNANDEKDKYNSVIFDISNYDNNITINPRNQALVILNPNNHDVIIEYNEIYGFKEFSSSEFKLPFGHSLVKYSGETSKVTFSKSIIIKNEDKDTWTFEKGKYYYIFNPWKEDLTVNFN